MKLADGSGILPHGDPLTYHLRGPLLWVEDGRITFPSVIPTAVICNIQELYPMVVLQWATWLFGQDFLSARAVAHVAAQWLSILQGFGSVLWLLALLWKTYRPKNLEAWDALLPLTVWLATMAPETEWLVTVAKNNWLACGFALLPLFFWAQDKKLQIRPLATGASIALAYWTKATQLLFVLPLCTVLGASVLLSPKKKSASLAGLAAGALAVSLPFLLRNALWTGNPFFPSEMGPFRSKLMSDSDRLDISSFFRPFQIPPSAAFWKNLAAIFFPPLTADKPFAPRYIAASLIGLSALVVYASELRARFSKSLPGALLLLGGVLAALAWTGMVIGPKFFHAHLLAYLVLFRLAGIAGLLWLLQKSFRRKKLVAGGLALVVLGVAGVNLPVHVLWKDFWPLASGRIGLQEHLRGLPNGALYECMNRKLPDDARLASDWLNTFYYVKGRPSTIGNDAPLEQKVREKTTFETRLGRLKELGFTHVWLNSICFGNATWPHCSALGNYKDQLGTSKAICKQGTSEVWAL